MFKAITVFALLVALITSFIPAKVAEKDKLSIVKHAMVASCHTEATKIGLQILKQGGNAMDAFIAVTFAEYVLAEGDTSMAGPLDLLVYDPQTHQINNLFAGLKIPLATNKKITKLQSDDAMGKYVFIPGAIAGLEAAHKKYGRLPWAKLIEPAIKLARDGFMVSQTYAAVLKYQQDLLVHSEYGRKTFFPRDKLLRAGDTLRQPEVAKTLIGIQQEGAAYFYRGKWSQNFIETVNKFGGFLTKKDLNDYRPLWVAPLKITYRNYEVFAPGGRNFGGIKVLLALKVLENTELNKQEHWSKNIESLATMIRVARQVNEETWFYDAGKIDNKNFVNSRLTTNYAKKIWHKVQQQKTLKAVTNSIGRHSYNVVTVDQDGMIVSGTHTIESLPWGDGIFVGGVPLNNAGYLAKYYENIKAGQFNLEPFSIEMVLQNNVPIFASGFFASSMFPADFQVLVNLLDFKMNPEQALRMPRFSIFLFDWAFYPYMWDETINVLDRHFRNSMAKELNQLGIKTKIDKYGTADLGMGVLIKIDPANRALSGATPEQIEDGLAAGF